MGVISGFVESKDCPKQPITMYIPNNLRAKLRTITLNVKDSNRVYAAMIHAIQSSMKEIRNWSKCSLLRTLKQNKIGTNEVE